MSAVAHLPRHFLTVSSSDRSVKCEEVRRELSTISAQNESSSQETASSVKEIKLITETVSEKAESIKDLSSKLGQMVGGFKV